ncbi:Short stature homeobox protein 2 [Coemansia thaxteri]|nr:Short stature homeobox protein 2 [Coemansia thaxteri]
MPSADLSSMLLPVADAAPIADDMDATEALLASTPTAAAPPQAGAKSGGKLAHRKRARATTEQVTVLESVFMVNRSPASRLREDLAARLGMAPRQVQVWFQNRRAKEKTQQRNPRGLQHHPGMLFDPLAYGAISPDFYSMAAAASFMPLGADAAPAPSMCFGSASAAPFMPLGAGPTSAPPMCWSMDIPHHAASLSAMASLLPNSTADPSGKLDGVCPVAAAAPPGEPEGAFSVAGASPHAANINDSRRESEVSAITAVASPAASDPAAMPPGSTVAAAAAASRAASPATSASVAAAASEPARLSHKTSNHSLPPLQTAPTAPEQLSAAPPPSARLAGSFRRPAPLSLVAGLGGMPPAAPALSSSGPGSAGLAHSGGAMVGRPTMQAGLHLGNLGMGMGMGAGVGVGYAPFIPEIPSYMVLDAAQLTVGSWHRVPMPDTELTCLACVEPPPLKPVQRPGNHRPTELDSLIGEFQWIIGSCGMRYKMVLPYTTIARIKFRELPDPAVSLVDLASESVINPQAALSLLSRALKNPHAKGELSIHVYDLPSYYYQTESGEWKAIGDFSENMSSSSTYVHTVSGSFASLFYQLRILLATCSRLKIAADALMLLWLGNMDDPYSAIAGIPHNTWIPCAETVCLHSTKRPGDRPACAETADKAAAPAGLPAGLSAASSALSPTLNVYMPVSAASSTIGTLTPTPTSMHNPHSSFPPSIAPPALSSARSPVFTFHDGAQPSTYHSSLAAAMASGSGGVAPLPLKTQRSASLPFIRSVANATHANGTHAVAPKANPSSSLCRTIDGDSASPTEPSGSMLSQPSAPELGGTCEAPASAAALTGLGISNTPPPAAALPLRHRTSCNHLRRPAPYQMAPPTGSSWANSPQMSPSPFWQAHSLRRTSRDSLSGHYHAHSMSGLAAPPGAFVRRESDVELALAMNNAFANGDVFGTHRGIADFYASAAVLPSPLSNMTLPAASSAMQVDSEDMDASTRSEESAASHCLSQPHSLQMGHPQLVGVPGAPALLPPNEVYGPTTKPSGLPMDETMNLSNSEIVMAIFNAMSNAAAGSAADPDSTDRSLHLNNGLGMPPVPVSADPRAEGMFDPTALGFDPSTFMLTHCNNGDRPPLTGPHSMDWCFDWGQQACAPPGPIMPECIATAAATSGLAIDKSSGEMSVDWTASGSSTAVADVNCPAALSFGAMSRSATQSWAPGNA